MSRVTKGKIEQRIRKKLERWGVPPHKYGCQYIRNAVRVSVITRNGPEHFDAATNLGSLALNQHLAEVDAMARRCLDRVQTDLEDFTS